MTRVKRVAFTGLVMTVLGGAPVYGQAVVARTQTCESGVVRGNLGISGLDCVGECEITYSRDGKEEIWDFSTEPRVFSVEPGSPADGILREGDFLVAIDGLLITTREGGRRYGSIEPGETVTIRYRREGRVQDAAVRAGSQCVPRPARGMITGRALPAPPAPRPDRETRIGVSTVPRVRVLPDPVEPVPPPVTAIGVGRASVAPLDPTPRGRLGIGLSCEECGTRTDDETGQSVWFFSGPIEVTQVNTGGPAEKAGIQLGDLITAIEGHDISTEAGGLAFSSLMPGEPVEVTVVKRNGREEEVTVVPDDAEPRGILGRAPRPLGVAEARPPRPAAGASVVTEPAAPAVVSPVEPMAAEIVGPEDLPLIYTGTLPGVEVVVRGGPVAVSELRGARTIIINANGLWIRIRVPAGGGQ
jgi:hypothetical protein